MKSFISALFVDKELIEQIREARVSQSFLYNQLINGKITLTEYLRSV